MADFAEIIEKQEFDFYGIRAHRGNAVEVGGVCDESMVWDDGECTEDSLDGTCAMLVREGDDLDLAIKGVSKMYVWDNEEIILIAGHYASHGEDDGEIVIRDAVRLA